MLLIYPLLPWDSFCFPSESPSKADIMARSFTFHMQIREDIPSQNGAENFRAFFSRPDAIEALDQSGIVHFARTVLIPNSRVTPGTVGTFAVQVVMVYDGKLKDFIDWLAGTNPLRELFVGISAIAQRPCADTMEIEDYLRENNLSRTARELHKGHQWTVEGIRAMFVEAAPKQQGRQALPKLDRRNKSNSEVA